MAVGVALRHFPGPALRNLDHLARIHQRRQFGGTGQHISPMGGSAGANLPARETHCFYHPRHDPGAHWRDGHCLERRLRLAVWAGLSGCIRIPARQSHVGQLPGPGRGVDRDRLPVDRSQSAGKDVTGAIHFHGLWHGGFYPGCDHVGHRKSPLWLHAYFLLVDAPARASPATHRPFNL